MKQPDTPAPLPALDATAAAARIRAGDLTASALTEACLERVAQTDGAIEAWAHFDAAHARRQAAACDALQRSGAPLGPLHGIPVAVKDIIDTADFPTECGTALFAGRQPGADATVTRLLREAGAVIFGKTVTTELAMGASGKTRNPHNPAHTPGGSSSDSAAAVAAGMVPLALGTQTAGSIIRPAAYCGIFGFKPSWGGISRHGVLADSPFFDCVGTYARSIDDLALIGDVLMRFDPADTAMRMSAAPQLARVSGTPPAVAPRFAFVRTAAWQQAEPATQRACDALAESLGASCREIVLPPLFDEVWELHRTIVDADMATHFGALLDAGPDGLGARLRDRIEHGRQVTAVDYNRALAQRVRFNAALEDIFAHCDAIITPATTGEAPLGLDSTGDPVFITPWTFCGSPALSLPLLEGPAGLPLGVQLVGRVGDDARLLRSARWLTETVTGSRCPLPIARGVETPISRGE